MAARLILEDPEEVDRFSFTHALVRETLYERPIASRRLRLHRRVAVALEAAPLAGASGRAGASLLPGARGRWGGEGDRVQPEGRRGERRPPTPTRTRPRTTSARSPRLDIVKRDDAAARCDVLLALGAARWQASEPDPRSTFVEAVELARGLGSAERLARAALGAGGRFYAPGTTDHPYIELLDEALAALEPGDSVLRVRLLARLAEKLVFAEPPERAGELGGRGGRHGATARRGRARWRPR